MTLQTSIKAKQIMSYSYIKKTDFCVNLFIPSEKAAVRTTLTDSTVLMFETGINVKQARFKCGQMFGN